MLQTFCAYHFKGKAAFSTSIEVVDAIEVRQGDAVQGQSVKRNNKVLQSTRSVQNTVRIGFVFLS